MARDVYSVRLFAGASLAPAGNVGPVVPAGVVWVVRDIDGVYRSSVEGQLEILSQIPSGLIAFWRWDTAGGNPTSYTWRGRQVFAEGEQVGVNVLSGLWDVAISGYQLTLP